MMDKVQKKENVSVTNICVNISYENVSYMPFIFSGAKYVMCIECHFSLSWLAFI